MKRLWIGLVYVACFWFAGCGQNAEVEQDQGAGDGLEISVPGVEVRLNEKDGLSVKAPHTDVQVDKEGIDVEAPGTDVELKKVGADGKASSN